ncbi:M24 family metallopeptidase [Paenibacillaceae bacterium WGS1546]|uniref:M24 family metallopeptidase n=1 Tax=Cohnella sp. WGS1546 TaxID=3366810 RepID=UPI00372D3D3C
MEARRLELVRQRLSASNLDGLLVTNPHNRKYMTGFSGSAGYVLVTQDQALLLTDFRYTDQAAEQAKAYEVVKHAARPADTIADALRTAGVRRLGFEHNHVTYASYEAYREQFAGVELAPAGGIVEELRAIKDEREIGCIRKAVELTELAFDHILGVLKPGMSELDVSAELEYAMRRAGAPSSAYATIVASGERGALPHGLASGKRLARGELVTLDFGASCEGYCADLTRTVCLGTPSEKQKELYAIVLEANRAALEGLKPGMSGKDGDSLARTVIAERGYGPNFGHGLGHAFGLEIHEPVRLSQQSDDILRPGMALTVEPGIYVPGFGGVRIEDDIVVTETGIEVLTKSNKELIVL